MRETEIGGEDSEVQDLDLSDHDEEKHEAVVESDACSKHDDNDQNSGSSRSERSSESVVGDYALTMAAAEASYSTFDIPKVMPSFWLKAFF